MTFEEFKDALDYQIACAQNTLCDERNVLDLRASRHPYRVIEDNEVFGLSEVREAYDFIKDAEEWYVDIYENFVGENYAEYADFAVVSWGQL